MFDFFDQIYPKRVFPVKNEKKTKTKKSFWFSFLFLSFSFHFIFVFVFIFVFIFVFVFLLFFFGFYFLNFTMAPLGHHTGWNTRGVFVGFIVDFCLSLLLNISLQFNISRIWLVFYTPFDAHYLILLPSFFREYTLTGLTEVPTDNLRTECNLVTSM